MWKFKVAPKTTLDPHSPSQQDSSLGLDNSVKELWNITFSENCIELLPNSGVSLAIESVPRSLPNFPHHKIHLKEREENDKQDGESLDNGLIQFSFSPHTKDQCGLIQLNENLAIVYNVTLGFPTFTTPRKDRSPHVCQQ